MGTCNDLRTLIDVEQIGPHVFNGMSLDVGLRSLYGGLVLAQGMMAAIKMVDRGIAHSTHAYFLRPGIVTEPIRYEVEMLRDGRNYITRRVTALQLNRPIFNMSVSFTTDEPGYSHQAAMPDVPRPEEMISDIEVVSQCPSCLPESLRVNVLSNAMFDLRTVFLTSPCRVDQGPPIKHYWFRTLQPMTDDPNLHHAMLAYVSDFGLLVTSLKPHGISLRNPGLTIASLDHALWFHRPFRIDEWLLYAMESTSAASARGFCRGQIFTRSGELVASVAQEGLIRIS